MITSNTRQYKKQHTLCILYAFQYCRQLLNKVSNDRNVCALVLWRYTQQRRSATLSQVVAPHMQLNILVFMHMKCCVVIDNRKIILHLIINFEPKLKSFPPHHSTIKICYYVYVML